MIATKRVSARRASPSETEIALNLGLLADLAGTWEGSGFNLIARPDFHDSANLYLQLNETHETLKFEPIGSSIPNRGFGQDDIELQGLTYLQKIHDANHGGALHIEPGIWITQAPTSFPAEAPPAGAQLISRMGSVPHGNALLAQGIAEEFDGDPTLATASAPYAFSRFPSFNSTPFPVPAAPAVPVINAAGSSEALTKPPPNFTQYDLSNAAGPANPRTPFDTTEPPLPASISGVPMQTVVNDPVSLLQAAIAKQKGEGASFSGTVLNIATQATLRFFQNKNSQAGAPTVDVTLPTGGGGVENIPFLLGNQSTAEANAKTATVYATFWIEKVRQHGESFLQLQYAQMTILDFPIFAALPNIVNIGWPHISVATLRKAFR
jgi:hypothetical protein